MQNFSTGDDRRAQRLLRRSALSCGVGPSCSVQEKSGQGASAAHEGELRFAHAARQASLSRAQGGSCGGLPLEMAGRSTVCFAPLVACGALLLASIRCAGQTTPPTARPREGVSAQAVNSAGRIDAIVTRYFCSLVGKLLENFNDDWTS